MIGLLASFPLQSARDLVLAALRRSVSRSMAEIIAPADLGAYNVLFVISPDERVGELLLAWLHAAPRKLVVFGHLPVNLKAHFNVTSRSWPEPVESWARSPNANAHESAESPAYVRYLPAVKLFGVSSWSRALERFDFSDEWNNLGFGAIRADGSIWSLAEQAVVPEINKLAQVEIDGEEINSYAALFTTGNSDVIWVNRQVGSIDSFEWRLIEHFLAHWRQELLPCVPVISEIPSGVDSVITMRLDCDENISSARPLWLAYREMGVPLSLAIHTVNLHHDDHHPFLCEFREAGGVLMSHTATHAPNWGGSYGAALSEGRESHDRIFIASGISVDYAVSPFHQSPHYALQALCDAGYHGCIGGIIRNDPEFLLARGGELAGLPHGFVGHSQQTMLHGDCMLSDGDPLAVFKAAFDRAHETRTLFGYLDHPFSDRYSYGWLDEDARIKAHRELIAYIRQQVPNSLFIDEVTALDFIRARAAIRLMHSTNGIEAHVPELDGLVFAVEFRGRIMPLLDGSLLL